MKFMRKLMITLGMMLFLNFSGISFANYVPDYLHFSRFDEENSCYSNHYGEKIELISHTASPWFYDYFKNQYEWFWIESPNGAVIKLNALRLIYDMEMSCNKSIEYLKAPIKASDFNKEYRFCWSQDMIQILSYYKIINENVILPEQPKVYVEVDLQWNKNLTRGEFAKILVSANKAWWHIPVKREKIQFEDAIHHWANEYIGEAYSLGLINGVSDTLFDPDQVITNEQVIKIMADVAEQVYSYTNFIDAVNVSDVVKITESYERYYDFSPKFTNKTFYYKNMIKTKSSIGFANDRYPNKNCALYKDRTLYVLYDGALFTSASPSLVLSNYITNTKITCDNPAFFNIKGSFSAVANTEGTITVSNKYGSDSIKIKCVRNLQDFPQRPQ